MKSDPHRLRGIFRSLLAITVLLFACAPVLADEQALRRSIQGKIMLAQNYLKSRTAVEIVASESSIGKDQLERARELVEKAVSDLAQDMLDSAMSHIDASLKLFTAAAATNTRRRQSRQQDLVEIESMRAEISAYLESYRAALNARGTDGAAVLDQIEIAGLVSNADQFKADGDFHSAKTALGEARQMVVVALARMRDKETVIYTVEFETPGDEFRYEQERYREYVTLGEKVLASGEIDQSREKLFKSLSSAGKRLSDEAEAWAGEGDYHSAINRMQAASIKLIKGLQLLGLPLAVE